ncbi:hypothetical protein [Segatella sp.]|jgi:hypothetical protein|uniref:hypothetical protein n=1 Tax=Segatella sp. TaxID=2974253 RepID=UPI0020658654|nr:MAG TPA: hypothetical protein [Caudoviricetes sp.]
MPLNKTALAQSILKLMTDARKETEIDDSKFANGLADAIDAFVKTGEVQAGIPVSTAGSATAQTGATTGPGKIL